MGDFGDVVVSGRIQFSLKYDFKREELHVHIMRCQDLAPARKKRSDPYVYIDIVVLISHLFCDLSLNDHCL